MFSHKVTSSPPSRVVQLRGVIFQSDDGSSIGAWFIRPVETFDRWLAGADRKAPADFPKLAMHAGLHVVLDDGREMVGEQLVGTAHDDFVSGLHWTPIEQFRKRDRAGWDVTIPATAFRGIDDAAVAHAVSRLNTIRGHPFLGEDCTAFVERVFERRLFADSPILRTIGIGARIGDPALPLLRPDVTLDRRTADLIRSDVASRLPDALAGPEAPNIRLWGKWLAVALAGILVAGFVARRRNRRS
jgi:hypothetical protein